MVYFISGHRDVSEKEFEINYARVLRRILETEPDSTFVVGDYQGVDLMAQNFLVAEGAASRVTVYHMFKKPRFFNPAITSLKGGYTDDIDRDSAMTKESNMDIAFVRSGKWASGTAQNIKRRHAMVTNL